MTNKDNTESGVLHVKLSPIAPDPVGGSSSDSFTGEDIMSWTLGQTDRQQITFGGYVCH